MKTLVDITNNQLKRVCKNITHDLMGMTPTTKDIILFEASENYVMWGIGNTCYSYTGIIGTVAFYPNTKGEEGCIIAKDFTVAPYIADIL